MQKLKYALLALPMLLGSLAHAQTAGTITFNANQISATGSLVPVLTWSTTPVATSCTAGGSWSGTKFASGSETLASITSSKAYTLTCAWGNGSATVSWTAPTKNTDNTTLTDLKSFKVMFGTNSSALNQSSAVSGATTTSATIAALASGTWYFAVRAVNAAGVESANSAVSSKTITSATAAKTVNITITGTPPPTSLKTINITVFDYLTVNGARILGRSVGYIAIGQPCQTTFMLSPNYYPITRSSVRVVGTPRSTTLLARCASS